MLKLSKYPYGGFTLIELLVVVLIIGILAAIALPQYKVSVEKTKATLLFSTMRTIRDAEISYYLTNNQYTQNIDLLDVDIPKNLAAHIIGTVYKISNDSKFLLLSNYIAGGTNFVQIDLYFSKDTDSFCLAKKESQIAEKICRSLGVTHFSSEGYCGMIGSDIEQCKGGKISI